MKKFVVLLLTIAMIAATLGACADTASDETASSGSTVSTAVESSDASDAATDAGGELKAAFITPQRLGDEGPVDTIYAGAQGAADDCGVDLQVVETQSGEYEESMRAMINDGCTLIIAVFPELADAVATVSKEYPDIDFIHAISSTIGDNVAALGCMYQDSAFVMGCLAAMLTETDKIAFIYGADNADGHAYYDGFVEGIQYINPEITDVPYNSVGSFEDAITSKEIALTNYNNGCDVIFSGGGKQVFGIMEAVDEMGEGYYYLSCTGNYTTSDYYPGRIPAVHYEDLEKAMYDMLAKWAEGNFEAEMVAMQLKNGYFSCLLAEEADCHIDQEIRDRIAEIQQQVIDGEIVVESMITLEDYVQYIQ